MAIGARLTAASDYLFRRLFKLLFRYDIFISYARRDGKGYALKLKEQLTRLDFSCFLDYDELPAGNSLNRTLKRAIRRSATLIVVGTEGALQSRYVELEVAEFAGTGRAIIPVDFEGTLAAAPWSVVKERDLIWVEETKEALAKNLPSPAVADAVDKLFKYTRRNVRVRWQVIATAALFVLGAAASTFVIRQQVEAASVERRAAEDARGAARLEQERAEAAAVRARQQEEIATANALRAQQKEQEAKEKAEEARKQGEIARKQTAEAQKQAGIAAAKAAEARQQQRLATERQKLATSRELISAARTQLAYDPELSVLLASEAVRVAGTDATGRAEAESMPRQSASASHVRVVRRVSQESRDFPGEPVFSPDGGLVATAEPDDHAVRVWRSESGDEVALLRGHTGAVTGLAFSPDGLRVAAAGADQTARVWDLKVVQQPLVLRGHKDPLSSIAFSPNGSLIVTSSDDATARVWDAGRHRLSPLPAESGGLVNVSALSPDGSLVVTGSGEGGTARVRDARTGKLVKELVGHTGGVSGAVFSPDGKTVVTVDKGPAAHVWEAGGAWSRKATLTGHEPIIFTAMFSRDGSLVATVGGIPGYNEGVRVWDATAYKFLTQIEPAGVGGSLIPTAAFSPDGQYIVTSGGDKAQVWESRTGHLVTELEETEDLVEDARFSPDGRYVVAITPRDVRVK